jgi:hypothetical protein
MPSDNRRRRIAKPTALLAAGAVIGEALATWARAHKVGGNLVVRCQEGHLFTTIWVPGASLKSVRLGWWRLQRCPVGNHWSVVTPVDPSTLSGRQRRAAGAATDIRIP